jgi:hypothetical protein
MLILKEIVSERQYTFLTDKESAGSSRNASDFIREVLGSNLGRETDCPD